MRRFLIALSFANLWYAPVWKRLIDFSQAGQFGMKSAPSRAEYAAAICGVILCALLVFAITSWLRKAPGFWQRLDVPIGLSLISLSAQSYLNGLTARQTLRDLAGSHLVLSALAILGLLVLLTRYHHAVRRGMAPVLLTLLPFCAYTFAASAYRIANPLSLTDKHAALLPNANSPRLLWIIFDEWDQRLTFDNRPAGLELPALDRLRAESFYAQNALPPADATIISIPSIIHGRQVRTATPVDAQTLALQYSDGTKQRFGDRPNLFSDARNAGWNAAIYGWYLPYCRVLGDYLADCWWRGFDTPALIPDSSFAPALLHQLRGQFETARYSPFGASLSTQKHASTFETLLERAKEAAVNPHLQLTLVHFDVPHAPFIYDRSSGQISSTIWRPGYTDALALVDKTIAELRSHMEQAGVWDSVVLLLSADHFYRASPLVNGVRDHRVPFLVHFPGEKSGLQYAASFNTVVTYRLIQAALHSQVTSAASAGEWLDQNAEPKFEKLH
jgi:sulfatase-like protein